MIQNYDPEQPMASRLCNPRAETIIIKRAVARTAKERDKHPRRA